MELVRSADPLDGEVNPATPEAAESLLREILSAPRGRRRAGTRPSTTVAARLAAVGVAAAVAIGAAFALTGDRGGVTPASAAVVKHALAAVAQHPGTILHVDVSGTQTADGTPTVAWRDESWQQNSAPYARRQVEKSSDGTTESASAGKTEQVYDPVTNTIYTSTPTAAAQRRFWLFPGPTAGTYTLPLAVFMVTPGHGYKVVPGGRRETLVITARQARALKDGTDVRPAPLRRRPPRRPRDHRRPRHARDPLPGRPHHLLRPPEHLRPRRARHHGDRRRHPPPREHLRGAARRRREPCPGQPHRPTALGDRRPRPGRLRGGGEAPVPARLTLRLASLECCHNALSRVRMETSFSRAIRRHAST
jgi:hypothetical protein